MARQQDERHHWIDQNHEDHILTLVRQRWNERWNEAQGTDDVNNVDTPIFFNRVTAIDELREVGFHIGPTRPVTINTGFPVFPLPNGVRKRKVEERRDQQIDQV